MHKLCLLWVCIVIGSMGWNFDVVYAAKSNEVLKKIQRLHQTINQKTNERKTINKNIQHITHDIQKINQRISSATTVIQKQQIALNIQQRKLRILQGSLRKNKRELLTKKTKLSNLLLITQRIALQSSDYIFTHDPLNYMAARRTLSAINGLLNDRITQTKSNLSAVYTLQNKITHNIQNLNTLQVSLARRKNNLTQLINTKYRIRQEKTITRNQINNQIKSLHNTAKKLQALLYRLQQQQLKLAEKKKLRKIPRYLFAPVRGKIIGTFHQSTGYGSRLTGIRVLTAKGAIVRAPFDAKVAYAAPFQSLGPIVILEHKGHYYSTFVGLAKILVREGELIKAKTSIGYMPSHNPVLFYELRRYSQILNPFTRIPKRLWK